jgi:FkbM family methyltransferase
LLLPENSKDNMVRHCLDISNPNIDKVELIASLIPANANILDVGANIGTISIPLAAMGHNVIAIEALPSNFNILKDNIEINNFKNITAINIIANKYNGENYIIDAGACSYIIEAPKNIEILPDIYSINNLDAIKVCSRKLDDALNVQAFDFIKMDIEGSEVTALGGMTEILKNSSMILFESNKFALRDLGYTSAEKLYSLIKQSGYDIYIIDHNNDIHYSSALLETQIPIVVDYLAVKPHIKINKPIKPSYTYEELIIQLTTAAKDNNTHQRAHVGELITNGTNPIFKDERLIPILNKLRNDEVEYVRAACIKLS